MEKMIKGLGALKEPEGDVEPSGPDGAKPNMVEPNGPDP